MRQAGLGVQLARRRPTRAPAAASRAGSRARRPSSDDTVALEKLAETAVAKRRLLVQLLDLGLPIVAVLRARGRARVRSASPAVERRARDDRARQRDHHDRPRRDASTLHREALRVSLGEPYRTMLGHFRHEIGHYYQWQCCSERRRWCRECRALFGDERASYQRRHRAPLRDRRARRLAGEYISEYATMHPWEDFAECFAHYLHITGTLQTAARQRRDARTPIASRGIARRRRRARAPSYADASIDEMLDDWRWLSLMFNRINRAMGKGDLYPFTLAEPVARKLGFVHRLVTASGVERPLG